MQVIRKAALSVVQSSGAVIWAACQPLYSRRVAPPRVQVVSIAWVPGPVKVSVFAGAVAPSLRRNL